MKIQFGMTVLYTRDLTKSIEFYRALGLEIPDPHPDRPVSIYRMPSGLSIIFTTEAVAAIYDSKWKRPEQGYRQVMEFVVGEDSEVDTVWDALTSAGYRGLTAPTHITGPYAAMVEDPDGIGVLISSDIATLTGSTPA
jgi:predicted lactoylglutathione lyase